MRSHSSHAEWMSLIEVSGPFVAQPILKEIFPQGLDVIDTSVRQRLRAAYSELSLAIEEQDSDLLLLHTEWINFVLKEILEFDDSDLLLKESGDLSKFSHYIEEQQYKYEPDIVVKNGSNGLMLIATYPSETKLEVPLKNDKWAASPLERMVTLCRSTEVPFGLVTNGERWTFINAKVGQSTTYASWYSRIWIQEVDTLRAFVSLLGIRRFYAPEEEQLSTILARSLDMQQEISSKLSEQVGQAIEVLVQSLDRSQQSDNSLLKDIAPPELYEAGLTVMMRLVFLLCAEERDLLLSDEPLYESNYALSPLRSQLSEEADRHGPEVLERRHDAWPRLLALFRAVYGGIEHESLRLPPLGGSLFDPDRFPFLEGRTKGTSWKDADSLPLPIDNRTVLLLLEALQVLDGQTLSYRALDVEHIGYVYEGLLERTVNRLAKPSLKLIANKGATQTVFSIDELETWQVSGNIVDKLSECLKRTKNAISNSLNKSADAKTLERLIIACGEDRELADRMSVFAELIATDTWGYPRAYQADSYVVANHSGRRDSGSHYTPKSLTEAIVEETLTPIVYNGPANGVPKDKWQLKSSEQLLELKVCDPAMGSGAFLVQVCRWLSERLIEAWSIEEENDKFVCIDGHVHQDSSGRDPMPEEKEERLIQARRLIAERCLYGVDLNPLAVELAKLSIWLITVAKGRPFGFLDHNFKHGDSLLGVTNLDQITHLHIDPKRGKKVHRGLFNRHKQIQDALALAVEKRKALRELPILDIFDVQRMETLDTEAKEILEPAELVADSVVGEALAASDATNLDNKMKIRADEAARHLSGDLISRQMLIDETRSALAVDNPSGNIPRKPFHWAMEFPEVFIRVNSGFDAMVGNPPFIGGQKITGVMGTAYREYLVNYIAEGMRGPSDIVAYFFLKAYSLLRQGGCLGLIGTKTISEGVTKSVGLEQIITKKSGTIYSSTPKKPWPGDANVLTSTVHIVKGEWNGQKKISNEYVENISPSLSPVINWKPQKLKTNLKKVFQGSITQGLGFIVDPLLASEWIKQNESYRNVVFPYLNGFEVNQSPTHKPERWIINFWDWSEEKAKQYSLAYEKVLKDVKPERQTLKENGSYKLRNPLPQLWWIFGEKRPALYHAIGRGDHFDNHPKGWVKEEPKPTRVLVFARAATKYPCYALVPNEYVYSDALCVISDSRVSLFTLLSSDIHIEWAWEHCTLKHGRMRYTHSSIFETLPLPSSMEGNKEARNLIEVGNQFLASRENYMQINSVGLTDFYNELHNQNNELEDIVELREIQKKLSEKVLFEYGWEDIDLEYNFYNVPYIAEGNTIRFTISPAARLEILQRLSILNKKRYEAEQTGSTQKIPKRRNTPKKATTPAKKATSVKPQLQADSSTKSEQLGFADMGNKWGANSSDQILAWLEYRKTWADQQTILNGCGANINDWAEAIKELLEENFIEQKQSNSATLYRAKS